MYDVIVIGGGASGIMAAAAAGKQGAKTLLIEKNARLGDKLRISGGGRCNILNAEEDSHALLNNYGQAAKFLHSAFNAFGMDETYQYFESIGLPLKVETKKRAFPASDSAEDVVKVLESEMGKQRVTVIKNSPVQEIIVENRQITAIKANGQSYQAKAIILATGGQSRPETGSTGDGFKWLQAIGHSVREPTPNITPLKTSASWQKTVSGVKVDAEVSFYNDGKRQFKIRGDVLFTHFGISGPVILNNAYRVAELLESGEVVAKVDLFPGRDEAALDQQVINTLDQHRAKSVKNTLKYVAPSGLAPALNELLDGQIDLSVNCSELSKKARRQIVQLLKAMPLGIEGLMGFERAVVADGGVDLSEIDMRTMRSNLIENLYITGDLLDINRPSGGYSLQLCWTTGHIAGVESARRPGLEL